MGMDRQKIKRMWELIPEAEGCESCGHCCGPLPLSDEEGKMVGEYLESKGVDMESIPKKPTLECPLLDDNRKCMIYEVRPTPCRLFGVWNHLKCAKTQARAKDIFNMGDEFIGLLYEYSEEMGAFSDVTHINTLGFSQEEFYASQAREIMVGMDNEPYNCSRDWRPDTKKQGENPPV